MIDDTLDSLDFTDLIWGFQLNLSSIIISKNLVAATRGNTTLLIVNANSLSGVYYGTTCNLFSPNLMIIYQPRTAKVASMWTTNTLAV